MSNIYTALAKAQSEMGKALKDSKNPHFGSKYADLASVMDACRAALTSNGICVFHEVRQDEISRNMMTVLAHGESDTRVEIAIPLILGKNDMQGLGSAMTYARRYGIMALTGLAPEDDDGNAAAAAAPKASKTAQGLNDAWKDAILDSLPEDATDAMKAEAFAQAICDEFQNKGEKAMANAWDKRAKIIASLESRFPDLHAKVVDAYENRVIELTDATREKIPA